MSEVQLNVNGEYEYNEHIIKIKNLDINNSKKFLNSIEKFCNEKQINWLDICADINNKNVQNLIYNYEFTILYINNTSVFARKKL